MNEVNSGQELGWVRRVEVQKAQKLLKEITKDNKEERRI